MEAAVGTGQIAVVLTMLGSAFVLFRFISSEANRVSGLQDRARQDLAAAMNAEMEKLDRGLEQLKREAVRREEIKTMEDRLTTLNSKLETKIDRALEVLGPMNERMETIRAGQADLSKRFERLELIEKRGH